MPDGDEPQPDEPIEPQPSPAPAAPVDWGAPAAPEAPAAWQAPVTWEVPDVSADAGKLDVAPLFGRILDTYLRRWSLFLLLSLPAAASAAIVAGFTNRAIPGDSPWAITFLTFPISILMSIATTIAADDIRAGRETGLGSAVGRALPRLIAALVSIVIEVLAIATIVLVPTLIFAAGTTGGSISPGPILIGAVLFLIAFVFVAVIALRWVLSMPAIALDREGPVGGLRRSSATTKGNLWRLFAVFLFLGLLTLPLTIGAVALQLGDPPIAAAGTFVGALITGALFPIMLALAYGDLTGRPTADPLERRPVRGRAAFVTGIVALGILASVVGIGAFGSRLGELSMAQVPVADRGKIFAGTIRNPLEPCRPSDVRSTFGQDDTIYIGGYFRRALQPGESAIVTFYIDGSLAASDNLRATFQPLGCYYEQNPVVGASPGEYRLIVSAGGEILAEGSFIVE